MCLSVIIFITAFFQYSSAFGQTSVPDNYVMDDVCITIIMQYQTGDTVKVKLSGRDMITFERVDDGFTIENITFQNPNVMTYHQLTQLYQMDFFNMKDIYPNRIPMICLDGDTIRMNCFQISTIHSRLEISCRIKEYEKRVRVERSIPRDLWDYANKIIKKVNTIIDEEYKNLIEKQE